jgi:hypothetical protein
MAKETETRPIPTETVEQKSFDVSSFAAAVSRPKETQSTENAPKPAQSDKKE